MRRRKVSKGAIRPDLFHISLASKSCKTTRGESFDVELQATKLVNGKILPRYYFSCIIAAPQCKKFLNYAFLGPRRDLFTARRYFNAAWYIASPPLQRDFHVEWPRCRCLIERWPKWIKFIAYRFISRLSLFAFH